MTQLEQCDLAGWDREEERRKREEGFEVYSLDDIKDSDEKGGLLDLIKESL